MGPEGIRPESANHVDNSYMTVPSSPTVGRVHWDGLFEDLEGQLAAEWESDRAALDAESERLRISRLELRTRLRMLCSAAAPATVDLPGGHRLRARLQALGADWIATVESEGSGSRPSTRIIPLHALRGIEVDHGLLLSSLEQDLASHPVLRERMSLGFVLRDLARRRVPVRVISIEGVDLHGTVDRAGADHLDLALHDQGEARVAAAVRGFRVIPFRALACVQTAGDQMP
ncbi:hypothetical protein SAMN04489807_2462 [Microbacterium hydrocarbonoxydans]|uniref:Uncharacterized protein n=2 Tax=Microbacterium hydrocarbonoxydans TaxID=273678 RepID=A0A1H4NFN9_9MICO|nr:hypothetical protein SAMN04489807_2462 [Microbacterium hydrocarbonoxydans]